MAARQEKLFVEQGEAGGRAFINARCQVQTLDGYRVVHVGGLPLAHYAIGDRMSEAYAMVSLVSQGWAQQNEVARAFECSERTVRRQQRRFDDGGLAALGRPSGYPSHRPRLPERRKALISGWKAEGESNREIARRLGQNEKAVRKLLRRLGWKSPESPRQLDLVVGADPNLSGQRMDTSMTAGSAADERPDLPSPSADPNLSGSIDGDDDEAPSPSVDTDPSDRQVDRLLASLGLLDDAAPLFRSASRVPHVGVLLAVPMLLGSGVIDIAREVYGSIGPAFYGLRTTIVTLLLMALMRIKRPENIKEHSPEDLGRLLGLDRAPEVKTLRRKLARLAATGRAADLGRALAERRVQLRGHAMGFLYVDGHVRAYHGKRKLPKAYVTRRHLAMPATTDYWVNDTEGEPLFVITCEANKQLATMLPVVLAEVRSLVGERRVTVVFDRGGWSPKLFKLLIAGGFDILTYRKQCFRRVPRRDFSPHEATIDGRTVRCVLADRAILLLNRTLPMRQVTRLGDDGRHQIGIVTSRRDLPAIEVAYRMSERWRQENFFKYLRAEYALDALVDYGVEPADASRMIPNPARRALSAQIGRVRAELDELTARYGVAAMSNPEALRRTMRGFKIANAAVSRAIDQRMQLITRLQKRSARIPARVPVQQVAHGEVVKLAVEKKHITDLLKMVAYQSECDLLRLLAPDYARSEDEGRALLRSALLASGDIAVAEHELRIKIDPLSSPHRTAALADLCRRLNESPSLFPGSKLRLRFDVNPEPPESLAFPGPRSQRT